MASSGQYIELKFTPTVQADLTPYSAEGHWFDCNRMRVMAVDEWASIGGWRTESFSGDTLRGVCRQIHPHQDITGTKRYTLGTSKMLAMQANGQMTDITPITRVTTGLTNPITTSSGLNTVTFTQTSHGAQVGDAFQITAATSPTVGGFDFTNFLGVITAVPDDDHFTFTIPSNASSTATGGGTVTISYFLPIGMDNNTALYGYGAGTYGTPGAAGAGYGLPRATAAIAPLRTWSIVSWGEDTISNPRGGGLYLWDATTPTARATTISGAPTKVNSIAMSMVSRQLVAFGAVPISATDIDPLFIRWSDTEDYSQWTPSGTNTAGSYRIPGEGEIVAAVATKQEILVFTRSQVWSMSWVGGTEVFAFTLLADNCGIVGPNAARDVNGTVYWWGTDGNFYVFNGSVKKMECTLKYYIKSLMFSDQKEKTYAGSTSKYNEVTWFYQSTSSTFDCDKYVTFNYGTGSFYYGNLDRSAWMDAGLFDQPVACSPGATVYSHEIGETADGADLGGYIESAFFDIDTGTSTFLVDQIVPDFKQNGNVFITLTSRDFPNGPNITKGPYALAPGDKYLHTRIRGRQIKIRFSNTSSFFQLGNIRMRIIPDGQR